MIDYPVPQAHMSHVITKSLCQVDYYVLAHYGHCFIYADHYNNQDHLAFGNLVLLPDSCYLRTQLNPLHVIHPTEQQHFQP